LLGAVDDTAAGSIAAEVYSEAIGGEIGSASRI
jgi:hypothetical protein